VPTRAFWGCVTLGWLVGFLVAGYETAAGLGVAAYIVFAGRTSARPSSPAAVAWAGVMLLGAAAYRLFVDDAAWAALAWAPLGLGALLVALLFALPPAGKGGPVGPRKVGASTGASRWGW
jgi:hypothetical protein